MGRRDEFEDDGRTVADMSDLEGVGLFGRHSSAWQNGTCANMKSLQSFNGFNDTLRTNSHN